MNLSSDRLLVDDDSMMHGKQLTADKFLHSLEYNVKYAIGQQATQGYSVQEYVLYSSSVEKVTHGRNPIVRSDEYKLP